MTTSTSPAVILGKAGFTNEELRATGVCVLGDSGPVSDSPQLLSAALDYAKRGWLVIPLHTPAAQGCSCGRVDCASPAKHPRTVHGLKDASRDPAVIREWWRRWPDANIGILTGPESGLLVLDVDPDKGGQESLIDLERRGSPLPDTFTVKTGGGGQHLYFAHPPGVDVRNSAEKIGAGLDVRAAAGYVVGAPSLHASGCRYEVNESAVLPAPCPEWLLSLIREANGTQVQQSAPAACAVEGERIPRGKGDPAKLTLAGSMFRTHQPFDVILAAIIALDRKCEHQRGEAECKRKVEEWAKRYARGESLADQESARLLPDLVTLADVQARKIDWLWRPRIAIGMTNELIGDSGVGKTTIAMNIAALGSRGRTPDGDIIEPFDTLYASLENPVAQVLRPKFDAMGGDPKRFHVLLGTQMVVDGEKHRGSITLSDTGPIKDAFVETGSKLGVFDPVQSFFGSGVDWNHANQTRPIFDALNKLADEMGVALLLLRHGTKASGGKAISKGLGSADQTAAARSSMLAGVLPDDEKTCALIHFATNIGPRAPTLGYAIDDQGQFTWTGVSSITAAELLASPEAPDRKLTEATQWLAEKLKAGSLEQREIREQAEAAGISYRTLQRAKIALRICSRKATFGGGWLWWLPANDPGSEAVQ